VFVAPYFANRFDLKKINRQGKVTVLFDDYFTDEIKLEQIRDGKLYAEYQYYQKGENPFRVEIDLISKETMDCFFDKKNDKYTYENPFPNLIERISSMIKDKIPSRKILDFNSLKSRNKKK